MSLVDIESPSLTQRIVLLMRDGRERTGADISNRLKVRPQLLSHALGKLLRMGILKKETAYNVVIWKRAQ